jgi:ribosomal protein L1
VAAYTYDDERKVQALVAGAEVAGDMEYRVREMGYNLGLIERVVADTEMEEIMKRANKFRTILKRSKLLACVEEKTLVPPDDFEEAVYKHVHGIYRPYQTDYHGNVTVSVGRSSLEDWQVNENISTILTQLFKARPNCFGTGPNRKRSNIGIFLLKMHLAGALNMSVEIDLDSFPFLPKLNSPALAWSTTPSGWRLPTTKARHGASQLNAAHIAKYFKAEFRTFVNGFNDV